jgi:thiamine-phosphate pyrophosphorylase
MTFLGSSAALYLIADGEALSGRGVLSVVNQAVDGGVNLVQLRGKTWSGKEFLDLGLSLANFLRQKKIPLIINDRVDIALACGADGAHLGQDDLPLHQARRILGRDRIIGISVSTIEEAIEAERGGADYIGFGPIYSTPSKETPLSSVGMEGVRSVRRAIRIPLFAIGGINAQNAPGIMEAGADGVAVISAILGSPDARKAAEELRTAIDAGERARSV